MKTVPTLPDTTAGIRDLSMMTMHFAVASRGHELAALRDRHVTEDDADRGLVVDLRTSKTWPRVVQVPYGSHPHLCPVRAWRRWRAVARPGPDDFAYRVVHSASTVVLDAELDPESVGDALTRTGECAGLAKRLTGHSPHRGLVTESARADHDDRRAEKQGGWAPARRSCASTARTTKGSPRTPSTACCRAPHTAQGMTRVKTIQQ
ncbi:site-specific integrase [Streptomyces rimosus]|uniref:hypothetical protein n=1 Tax=Streptomyces rimosus TaxID=1927 RepID=UPI00067CEE3F|nr:hypothetical protein [Streptomyces rimosus]